MAMLSRAQNIGTKEAPARAFNSSSKLVQRKCACGGTGGMSGDCEECQEKKLTLQRFPRDRTMAVPNEPSTPAVPEAATNTSAQASLIVEDEAAELGPGQMRKSEFLSELRTSVCATADIELARVGRNTESCPYISRAFEHYRTLSSQALERRLRRYAPEVAGAATARDYIGAVSARIGRAVRNWAETGQVTGVPEELAAEIPGMGLGGLLSTVGTAVGGLLGSVGSLFSGLAGMFFKARDGGSGKQDADPAAIQSQLGNGQILDAPVKSRMESTFGHDFSQVRVHTNRNAAELSANLNAHAFTIGGDIAFAAGEYQPGTLVGDALLAHELAHVVQQGGTTANGTTSNPITDLTAAEDDADRSAANAVVSLWGDTKGTLSHARTAPRLKSGIGLQRCSSATTRGRTQTTPTTSPAPGQGRTPSACPTLISMTAQVRDPDISEPRSGRCRMGLGECTTPRGQCGTTSTSGAAITATVDAAAGCTGELAFMQNILSSNRRRTLTGGSQECSGTTTPLRDGGRPWKGCVLPVTGPGRHTISTDDCPNIRLRDNMTAASADESFKTFLLWKPAGAESRTPIANVTWGWSGATTAQRGSNCATRWTPVRGSHRNGTGAASSETSVLDPSIQEESWNPCS